VPAPLRGKFRWSTSAAAAEFSAEAMARQGAQVLGVDLAERSLKVAQLHALEAGVSNLEYREVAAEALADRAACRLRCGHLHGDDGTCAAARRRSCEACARLVRPGGWVFFSTINRNARSWLHAIVGAEYLLKLLPAGTHDHARFIRPHELAAWCRGVGLDLRFTKGMGYNPVTRRYALDDDTRVNYLVACQKAA
jgi:2-polyprenyl-6-hydroxyphenyl methylase/3-demethylubiquinone-9 3-methyltransferase